MAAKTRNVSIGHGCPHSPLCHILIKANNSVMTQAIYMAIDLDQDIMVTNMCVKFGEHWTHTFQELDRKHIFEVFFTNKGP